MRKIEFIDRRPGEGMTEFVRRVWRTLNPDSDLSGRRDQVTIVRDGYGAAGYPTARRLRDAIGDDNAPVFMSEHYKQNLRVRTVWYVYEMGWHDGTPSRVAYAVMAG